jgi:hypothetical protein
VVPNPNAREVDWVATFQGLGKAGDQPIRSGFGEAATDRQLYGKPKFGNPLKNRSASLKVVDTTAPWLIDKKGAVKAWVEETTPTFREGSIRPDGTHREAGVHFRSAKVGTQ